MADRARALLVEALGAHRRGTCSHEEDYDAFGRHGRAAGRALMTLAAAGDAEPLWLHLDALTRRPSAINSVLHGAVALAGCSEPAGAAASRL